jgi:hypothetical protein
VAENWNETPAYREAHAAHVQAMTAAVAAENPEIAKLQADNAWLNKQAELRDAHYQATTARSALESAIAKVKEAYPHIPEALLQMATSPEQVQAIASAMPPPPKAPAQRAATRAPSTPAAAPTGGPPPSGTSAPSSEQPGWGDSGRRWNDPEYLQSLIDKANAYSGDGAGRPSKHVEEFIDLFLDNRVFTQMGFNPDGTSAI